MKLEEEIWMSIPDYENQYCISNHGRVMSEDKIVNGHNGQKKRIGKVLKPALRNGYLFVKLSCNNVAKAISIHVMTALVFCPNPDNKPTVNHKDGDKLNNYYKNLEWATSSEQLYHAIKLGLFKPIPPTLKGDKLSDETKERMSKSQLKRYAKMV